MNQQKPTVSFQIGAAAGGGLGGTGIGAPGQQQQLQGGLQLGGLHSQGGPNKQHCAQGARVQTVNTGGGLQLGQSGGLQIGGLQLGQSGGLQSGGLQLGQSGGLQSGGLQLGQSGGLQRGGLQLGQSGGLQSGGLQLGQSGSLQGGGLQLGQSGSLQGGGLQLGQSGGLQGGGLQLGQSGSLQGGGLQLGQSGSLRSGALQLGQAKGLQSGGLQLGQSGGLQSGGLQLGQTKGLQGGGGLQLGQSGGVQSGGLQLGQSKGLQSGGLQLGQSGGPTLQKPLGTLTSAPTHVTPTMQSGVQSTTSLGLTLGKTLTTSTVPTPQLGLSGSSTVGGLKLGGGLQVPTQTSNVSASGLKIGGLSTTASASKPVVSGSLQGGLKLGGGLLQASTPSRTRGSNVTTTLLSSGGASLKGLGGVDPSMLSASGSKSGPTSVMESDLLDILNQLVGNYDHFFKTQKEKSDEISKFSDSGFKKVKQETSTQEQALTAVSSHIMKDSQAVGFLKNETAEELMNAEVAQRTQELPAGLQHENTAPDQYFQKLVTSFETKMILYRREIEELESHLSAIATDTGMNPQNVIDILQLQYKPFLLLAAELQATHEHVQNLKAQYLSYRRVVLQDPTDIFEERRKVAKNDKGADKVPTGPSPFSSTMGQMTSGLTAYPTAGPAALGGFRSGLNTSVGLNTYGLPLGAGVRGVNVGGSLGTGSGTVGSGLSGLKLSSMSQPTLLGGAGGIRSNPLTGSAGDTQPFNLQRPPLGKRRVV